MYTQCPDCDVAFEITAEDLKQSGGKFRCRSCGTTFNATSKLSKNMPRQSATKKTNKAPPKSTSKVSESDSGPDHDITAEQSGEFQQSLDELDSYDILILDTGSEWRVLDDVEVAADDSSIDNLRPAGA